jgi:4-amino-4-deoxy-L-arabinose transferase-like glycosyltransferase
MPQALRHLVWIALAAGTVLFTNLGVPALWDEDEPKNAECAREMLARGDWLVPTFNEELRTDKPILLYWLMIGAYKVFGVTEFAARIWSAMFGVGTVLVTYRLGRLLFSPEVGLWSALALCTALMFDAVARAATPDSTLIFFTTLSLLAFVEGVAARDCGLRETGQKTICIPQRWHYFALMYLAMGLAVLAKGPVGVVLPIGVLGVFLLAVGHGSPIRNPQSAIRNFLHAFSPLRLARIAWSLRPITGALIVSAVALPWYLAVGIETDGRWLAGFLGNHNLGRFMRPMEGHRGPIFFYLPAILAGFFPWSVFLPASLVQAVKQLRRGSDWHAGYVFALCWAGLYVGFFSLARTKLPNYVLPAYPALALITGALVVRWQRQPEEISRWVPRAALAILAATGVGMLIGLSIAASLLLPGDGMLALVGFIPLAGAGLAFWHLRRNRPQRVVQCFAVMSVLLATSLLGVASVRVSRHQNSPAMAGAARRASPTDRRIATFQYYAPSLVFYAQQRVPECRSAEEVRQLFAVPGSAFLVTRPDHLPMLAEALPADVTVLARQRRFLRKGELVLLGRRAESEPEVAVRPDQRR